MTDVAFFRLEKIDEEKRLVYGRATQELKDRSGEMMDYASSAPNFEKMAEEFKSNTGGKSLGPILVSHNRGYVAGKIIDMHLNDDEKAVDICAKICDDNAWRMAKEGCFSGFSIGGGYGKKWKTSSGVTKYEAIPREVSLVASPCLSSARINLIRSDGRWDMLKVNPASEAEMQKFAGPTASKNQARKDKIKQVMHQWKSGTLKSGADGKAVTDQQQAIAIALTEAKKV